MEYKEMPFIKSFDNGEIVTAEDLAIAETNIRIWQENIAVCADVVKQNNEVLSILEMELIELKNKIASVKTAKETAQANLVICEKNIATAEDHIFFYKNDHDSLYQSDLRTQANGIKKSIWQNCDVIKI